MSPTILAFLAATPILIAGTLLVGFNWRARRAMPVVCLAAAVIALTVWDMSFTRVLASTL